MKNIIRDTIKKMCKELDNNKLFNTCVLLVEGSDNTNIFSKDEIEDINKTYNINLQELIDNDPGKFFKCLVNSLDKNKVDALEDWLNEWDDIETEEMDAKLTPWMIEELFRD